MRATKHRMATIQELDMCKKQMLLLEKILKEQSKAIIHHNLRYIKNCYLERKYQGNSIILLCQKYAS